MKIHPAAEAYRLMTDDELASLAEDIQANGQHDAIVLGRVNGADADVLVEGRNRLRACELAGVEPKFETREFADDDEVRAFVKSKNSERRNITKGQSAMAVALLFPEPAKRGRGNKADTTKSLEAKDFSSARLSQARAVLRHSPDLALAVRDGIRTLDEALKEVEASRQATQSAEAQLASLRAEAPDLADLVTDEKLAMPEAMAALAKRRAQQREQRLSIIRTVSYAITSVGAFDNAEFCKAAFVALADDEGRVELARHLGNEPFDLKKLDTSCDSFLNFMLARFKP